MNRTAGKIWNIFSTVLVALVVLLAALLVGVRIAGLKTYTVLSGSMEPVYPTGSLLYVKRINPQDLRVGDPITFMLDESTVVTHRILEILPDERAADLLRFRTKGDANDTPDGNPVHSRNIIGKPVFAIPYLGYFAHFVQRPPGIYLAVGAAGALLLLVFLPGVFKKGKRAAGTEASVTRRSDK